MVGRANPENAKNSLDSFVSSNWYWLDDFGRNSMRRWNELWTTKAIAEGQLRDISMDELRTAEQPDYASAVATNNAAAERLREMTAAQSEMDEAASLKWKSATFRLMHFLVGFVVSLWAIAFLIEAGWLAIRVAGDIRTLRAATESQRQSQ